MPETEPESDFEREEEQAAAAEAARIGGQVSDYTLSDDDDRENDPAELELEEHATHGDSHAAGRILEDADGFDKDARSTDGGEPDEEIKEDR